MEKSSVYFMLINIFMLGVLLSDKIPVKITLFGFYMIYFVLFLYHKKGE